MRAVIVLLTSLLICCSCGSENGADRDLLSTLDREHDAYHQSNDPDSREHRLNTVLSLLEKWEGRHGETRFSDQRRCLTYLRLFTLKYRSGHYDDALVFLSKADAVNKKAGLGMLAGRDLGDTGSAGAIADEIDDIDSRLSPPRK